MQIFPLVNYLSGPLSSKFINDWLITNIGLGRVSDPGGQSVHSGPAGGVRLRWAVSPQCSSRGSLVLSLISSILLWKEMPEETGKFLGPHTNLSLVNTLNRHNALLSPRLGTHSDHPRSPTVSRVSMPKQTKLSSDAKYCYQQSEWETGLFDCLTSWTGHKIHQKN